MKKKKLVIVGLFLFVSCSLLTRLYLLNKEDKTEKSMDMDMSSDFCVEQVKVFDVRTQNCVDIKGIEFLVENLEMIFAKSKVNHLINYFESVLKKSNTTGGTTQGVTDVDFAHDFCTSQGKIFDENSKKCIFSKEKAASKP